MRDEFNLGFSRPSDGEQRLYHDSLTGQKGDPEEADASRAQDEPPRQIPVGCERITPEMLSLVRLDPQQIESIVASVPGGVNNINDIYPLSPLQEGMLFHHLLNEHGVDTYVLSTLFHLQSATQIEALVDGLQKVIQRHQMLRSAVVWESLPRPVQVVYRNAPLPIDKIEIDDQQPAIEQLQRRMRPELQRFDLRRAPLMRLEIASDRRGTQIYALLHVHHLACDHQSLRLLVSETLACVEGHEHELAAPIAFRNYVACALANAQSGGADAFFSAKLGDIDEPTAPFGLLDVHGEGDEIDEAHGQLDSHLSERLRVQARRTSVSAARLFHVAWALVVAHTSGRDDIVFGTVLSSQRGVEARQMIGLSVNTLPLRLRLQGITVSSLVSDTDRELKELLEYAHVPLTTAQKCSAIEGTAPLFTALLNYRRSVPESDNEHPSEVGISLVTRVDARTNYPVTVTVDDLGDGFSMAVQTDRRIDARQVVGYLEKALDSVVLALEQTPDAPALSLSVLPDAERQRLVVQFNATAQANSTIRLIHELFEEQVTKTPQAAALMHNEQVLTYQDLSAKSSQLACRLRRLGVRPDQLVAICVERSAEMIVGLLGVLKAGGAYLPLDPSYPRERLEYMLQDAAPVLTLTQERLLARVPQSLSRVVILEDEASKAAHADITNLSASEVGITAKNLLYVIYTSGSTGRPKGTAMNHGAMTNLMEWHRATFRNGAETRVLQFAALSFDVAFQEIFSTLCTGGTLILLEDWVRKDARALLQWLTSQAVERLFVPPLMLQALAECASAGDATSLTLRDVITAGEQLRVSPEIIAFFQRIPGCRLHNHYGPTETHVVTAVTLGGEPCGWPALPTIGQPITNTQIYVLDRRGALCPLGVSGEIYIGGANVARGYLKRPELTAERFVPHPFAVESGSRLYQTGDLGRWRSDGTLEYLGRNDDQVKIRGFRVELGEIEAQLALHEAIKDAAVIAREDASGAKRLVAYVTLRSQNPPSPEQLRAHVKQALPEFMVPSAFVILDALPLTPSGKLHRRALPAPELSAYVSRSYEAPRGEIEEILAGIWSSLLHVDRVGRQDNFFELGGHSLLIVQLKERLRCRGLSVDLRSVFESPSLADLARTIIQEASPHSAAPARMIPEGCTEILPEMLPLIALDPQQINTIVRRVPGGAANVQDIYPLAPLQEGILFHHLLNEQGGDTYLVFIVLSVETRDRLEQLITAIQRVVDRHDILRTAVLWEELPQSVQVVCRAATLHIEEVTLDAGRDAIEQLKELIRPERQQLDLRRAPLMRLQVAKTDGEQWYAVLQLHHMTIDHVAIEIITSEVVAHLEGVAQNLLPPQPYRDHVAQVLSYARSHDTDDFFRSKLADVDEPTAPFGLLDVYGEGTQILEAYKRFEPALARRIRAQARSLGVSAATLFHAAWGLVVARTSGRDDVVFGDVLLGRLQGSAGAQHILGIFINTLPLRLRLRGTTAKELVEHTQRELIELLSHEQASLASAQRCSCVPGSAPLFTALLNYRHNVLSLEAEWAKARGIRMLDLQERTNYPIIVNIDDLGDGFGVMAQTDRRIDPQRLADYLHQAVQSLLDALERAPETPASLLRILPSNERRLILQKFNATQSPFPHDALLHELIEEQVARTPEVIAVTYENESLTYAELNARANRLAHWLQAAGIGPDCLVAICVERSLEMVVGLVGILKAGAAYVPLDPGYPAERLEYMLQDAGPRVVVTQEKLRAGLPKTNAHVLALDADWTEIARHSPGNIARETIGLHPAHLAYVIYTSGSTGKPKGAMNEHRAVINRLHWMQSQYRLNEGDCVLQKTPFSFDVSVWEFFWPLLVGARLVVARPHGHQDPEYLRNLVEQMQITTLHFVPSMLQIFLEQHRSARCPSLRHVVCSGEELPASVQRKFYDCLPHAQLSNLYGPTEAAVDVTFWECHADDQRGRVPIGRPIANVQIYILDRQSEPTPVEVTGEIYIGGVGVGRGYWNRPELTADRFVPDPFCGDLHARMYKTGDLGRWGRDGAIEYLGRNDHQVKIRGFRIELGEIEAQLRAHPQVSDAAVISREDAPGEKRLIAYLVLDRAGISGALELEALRTHLKARLPDYMVPSAFVVLQRLPLSPNGKLDRRALPAPELDAYIRRTYEAPQGPIEELLAAMWQSLLGVERVGRADNFFQLGGHSLLILQLMQRLRRAGFSADVRRVFENPVLADLASALTNKKVAEYLVEPNAIPAGALAITPQMLPLVELDQHQIDTVTQSVPGGVANVQDIYPLAPLQEGILFHHLFNQERGDAYVLPLVLSLPSRARVDQLISALQAVIARHDVLRTAILWEHLPQPVQVVYRQAFLPIEEILLDPACDPMEQLTKKLERQRLDIRQAPMIRLQLAKNPSECTWYALLQLHHMTIDHVTLEIVTSEVVAYVQGETLMPCDAVPYRNHVAQARAYARAGHATDFFREKLAGVDEPTAPFGLLDVHLDGEQIVESQEELPVELSRQVRAQARQMGVSPATLFHAAWALVVASTSNRDDVVFGSVLLGRLQSSATAQRSLGMFINTLPLRLRLADASAKEVVEQTQRELVQLLSHEQASLVLAQQCSDIPGSAPLFTALLNYRHSLVDFRAQWSQVGIQVLTAKDRTNFPVAMAVDDHGIAFSLTAQTDRRIDPRRLTGYLVTAVQALIEALERAPHSPVLSLTILPEHERHQLLEGFNATQADYPQDKLIHELFEEQVCRTPEAVALRHGTYALTYADLNAKADQLAHHLHQRGIEPGQRVAICCERSLELIVGILGTLKAGCAYVPLDPAYPAERLEYMLRDSAPRVLLIQERLRSVLPRTSAELLTLDSDWGEIARTSAVDLNAATFSLQTKHLAYVIYTSGSTGTPKGVMVEHRNVTNLWRGLEGFYDRAGDPQRVALNASFNFDASIQQLVQLLCGRTLFIVPQELRQDATLLLEFLDGHQIGAIDCTPAQLKSWIAAGLLERPGRGLRLVLVGGEAIDPQLWTAVAQCPSIQFVNVYGPTECTVDATAACLSDDVGIAPHIGVPMANRRVYILDSYCHPVPIGAVGEIYIGGAGVGRGYLNRAELTAERFLADPYVGELGARMYKTGDLGAWRNEGRIKYAGRNDFQVKIRGHRIELGEIEAQLMLHEAIDSAVVITREHSSGEKRLVAYLVPQSAASVRVEQLREHLAVRLPQHMVPNAFVLVDRMPLTPSGKVDRRALPVPDGAAYAVQQYEAPRGATEERLAEIWRELLEVERVGRQDNFFNLGGHSLLVLRLIAKVNDALNCTLRVTDVYKNPTLGELAARVQGADLAETFVDLSAEAMLDPQIVPAAIGAGTSVASVLLTGATGFVGRFLLTELLRGTDSTVYCLVRAGSNKEALSRLRTTLVKWDLWSEEFEGRVMPVAGDLRLPQLGIDPESHRMLCREIDSIYHCATSMNHLETYAMAKPANVDSARELLKLAATYKQKVINYVSTLGIFSPATSVAARTVDEHTPIEGEKHLSAHGYTASKWVGEKIFMTAAERGFTCNIFRLGLIWADAQRGRYDELQREYRVFKSCLLSGYGISNYRYGGVPTSVDYVARSLVYLANRREAGCKVSHIASAAGAAERIFERCNRILDQPLELLPFYDWIQQIKRLHIGGFSLPVVPLIEFAFAMDRASFEEYQNRMDSACPRFDSTWTRQQLTQVGIIAPTFDDDLLRVFLQDMLVQDEQLRTAMSRREARKWGTGTSA